MVPFSNVRALVVPKKTQMLWKRPPISTECCPKQHLANNSRWTATHFLHPLRNLEKRITWKRPAFRPNIDKIDDNAASITVKNQASKETSQSEKSTMKRSRTAQAQSSPQNKRQPSAATRISSSIVKRAVYRYCMVLISGSLKRWGDAHWISLCQCECFTRLRDLSYPNLLTGNESNIQGPRIWTAVCDPPGWDKAICNSTPMKIELVSTTKVKTKSKAECCTILFLGAGCTQICPAHQGQWSPDLLTHPHAKHWDCGFGCTFNWSKTAVPRRDLVETKLEAKWLRDAETHDAYLGPTSCYQNFNLNPPLGPTWK